MKRGTLWAFVFGIVIGSGVTYFVMREEVKRAVAEATERLGKTVRDMGQQVEKAGKDLKNDKPAKKR